MAQPTIGHRVSVWPAGGLALQDKLPRPHNYTSMTACSSPDLGRQSPGIYLHASCPAVNCSRISLLPLTSTLAVLANSYACRSRNRGDRVAWNLPPIKEIAILPSNPTGIFALASRVLVRASKVPSPRKHHPFTAAGCTITTSHDFNKHTKRPRCCPAC